MKNSQIAVGVLRLRRRIITGAALMAGLYVLARAGMHVSGVALRTEPLAAGMQRMAAIEDVVMVLFGVSVFWLAGSLRSIATEGLYSARAIQRFRFFSLSLLLTASFRLVAPAIALAVMPRSHGASGVIVILDVPDFVLVGIACVLFLVARILEKARALEIEVREFV